MAPPGDTEQAPRSGKETPSVPSLARTLARTISDAVAETAARLAPEHAGSAPVPPATLRVADFENAPVAPAASVAPAPQQRRADDRGDNAVAPPRPLEADTPDESGCTHATIATVMTLSLIHN